MTKEEILHKHISKECMDELSENIWFDMLDAMEEYAQQQVNSVDLADVGGSYRMLKDGERIQAGDEFINNHFQWKMSNSVGEIFTHQDYYPHRRLK